MDVRVLAVMLDCMDASRLLGIQRHLQFCPRVQLISFFLFFMSPFGVNPKPNLQDYLKDTKACLTNDFSRYKRALTSVRQDLPDAESLGQARGREQRSMPVFPFVWLCVCWCYSIDLAACVWCNFPPRFLVGGMHGFNHKYHVC